MTSSVNHQPADDDDNGSAPEHSINLIKVDDNKELREWAGFCKIDREGKVVSCSYVVLNDYGKETPQPGM